ncbi:MAG TPA: sulfatase-like hydrolase/transferase [Tepidisphaeraceae bacterium]|nr:sulfatase-like hydrolase/transferase [Tepidisphaeraceae bacterium]
MKGGSARNTILAALACAAVLALVPTSARAAERRPNLVIILVDDMGYGDIGPFGSKLNRTPSCDRLAAEGMRLTSFYAAPVCTPSRAQMLTGCYAKRVSLPQVTTSMPTSARRPTWPPTIPM